MHEHTPHRSRRGDLFLVSLSLLVVTRSLYLTLFHTRRRFPSVIVSESFSLQAKTLQREMQNMQVMLEKMHMENKRIMEEQHKKDLAVEAMVNKVIDLSNVCII